MKDVITLPCHDPPLIQQLEYNIMSDYGDQIVLVTAAQKIPELEANTNNSLQKLASITGSLPDKAKPTSFEQYITKVNRLPEITSYVPSGVTSAMAKTDALDPELVQICRRRFNSPYCTGYSTEKYRKGLELIINKDPND